MLIYKVTNLVNQKVYIGQTINTLDVRKAQHQRDCNRINYVDNYFHNALRKYGFESFTWEVLEECDDLDVLNLLEVKYIQEYDSTNKTKGYNLKSGGLNGGKCTEVTKLKIGASSKEKWKNPEIAERMLNGLRKGTETCKQRALENYEERICPVCGTSFVCKPWEKKTYCSSECAAKNPDNYMKGLTIANQKNAERIQIKDAEYLSKITEWVTNNSEILSNIKWNDLKFINDLALYIGVKDHRTVARILKCKNKKETVKKLIEINENIC